MYVFYYEISIDLYQPEDSPCQYYTTKVKTRSQTDDRIWSVLKTDTHFQISGHHWFSKICVLLNQNLKYWLSQPQLLLFQYF